MLRTGPPGCGHVGGRAPFPTRMPTGPLLSRSSINLITARRGGELQFPAFVPLLRPCSHLFKAAAGGRPPPYRKVGFNVLPSEYPGRIHGLRQRALAAEPFRVSPWRLVIPAGCQKASGWQGCISAPDRIVSRFLVLELPPVDKLWMHPGQGWFSVNTGESIEKALETNSLSAASSASLRAVQRPPCAR